MIWIYNILITLLSPIWVPWMLLRAKRRAEPVDWKQRTGNYAISMDRERPHVWIHAVSVGEVMACLPILTELRNQWPEAEIVLSVTTSSGHKTAQDKTSELISHLVYFPIDVPRFVMQAMVKVRPDVVAIMETELWMNFLWSAKSFDATTMLINGRISDRSFRRSEKIKFFYRSLLQLLDDCLMQTDRDRERIVALGAANAQVVGNCKFDQAAAAAAKDPSDLRQELALDPGTPLVVIGSSRGEEEEKLIASALETVTTKVQVIHAPRHLERVPEIIEQRQGAGKPYALRSKGESGPYIILDTYGELDTVYALADVVVIGGGFANLGGQNLIQPLAHGKPVLHGPHMQNFRDVADAALDAGASTMCGDAATLARAIDDLLQDGARRQQMSESARQLVASNVGASARYATAIRQAGEPVFRARKDRQSRRKTAVNG